MYTSAPMLTVSTGDTSIPNQIEQTIGRSGRNITATVEAEMDATVARVFDFVVAEDVLPRVLTGYGLVPAVVGTSGNTGPWDIPGSVRTVHLKGGDTAQEEVTEWVRPSYFAYRVSKFTFALKHLATEGRGQWWVEPRNGRTHVRWTYTFIPKGPVSALMLHLFVRMQWAGYMRVCLQNTIDLTSATVLKVSPEMQLIKSEL